MERRRNGCLHKQQIGFLLEQSNEAKEKACVWMPCEHSKQLRLLPPMRNQTGLRTKNNYFPKKKRDERKKQSIRNISIMNFRFSLSGITFFLKRNLIFIIHFFFWLIPCFVFCNGIDFLDLQIMLRFIFYRDGGQMIWQGRLDCQLIGRCWFWVFILNNDIQIVNSQLWWNINRSTDFWVDEFWKKNKKRDQFMTINWRAKKIHKNHQTRNKQF